MTYSSVHLLTFFDVASGPRIMFKSKEDALASLFLTYNKIGKITTKTTSDPNTILYCLGHKEIACGETFEVMEKADHL